ncbi:peptidoglycan-binding domain-containing protein, partial [Chitinispirillales bacterium ANBcel5]|uniref:peptidoglycan-binding domain-containing protein n=1 Tax=Cellulosispirillum alkaliphilum TaxID=3039283 RepID=UPI002A5812D8|nr:peptidoglycan-binding domain-containing protein [Chitinispirillales bacterium ANBcel5]
FTDMEVFKNNFVKRVESGGRLKMRVNYAQPPCKYELRMGDNDSEKIWGGEIHGECGNFVKELKNDLFSLGYWVTEGLDATSVFNGVFDHGLYSGLKTFQYEFKETKSLDVTGILDYKTSVLIKECINSRSFERPGVRVSLSNTTRLYQLQPSNYYKRYRARFPDYEIIKRSDGKRLTGDLDDVFHNHLWRTKQTIEALEKLAEEWSKYDGYDADVDMVEIGDISTWLGGDTRHNSHKDGQGVDIRAKSIGVLDRISYKYDRSKTKSFIMLTKKVGFGRAITMCPDVIEYCNNKSKNNGEGMFVTAIAGHQHHLHLDFGSSGRSVVNEHKERGFCAKCQWKNSCDSTSKIL